MAPDFGDFTFVPRILANCSRHRRLVPNGLPRSRAGSTTRPPKNQRIFGTMTIASEKSPLNVEMFPTFYFAGRLWKFRKIRKHASQKEEIAVAGRAVDSGWRWGFLEQRRSIVQFGYLISCSVIESFTAKFIENLKSRIQARFDLLEIFSYRTVSFS